MAMTPMEQYIREYAAWRGLNPDNVMRLVLSEGGAGSLNPENYARQSNLMLGGSRERSYGPFQMFMGGGLGNRAAKAGIDVTAPEDAYRTAAFAMDTMADEGMGAWHGWKGGPWEGINRGYKPEGPAPTAPGVQAASGDYKTAREDTPSYAHPTSDTFKLPKVDTNYGTYGSDASYGGPGEGASHFGGTGLGTPVTKGDLLAEKSPWPGGGEMPPIPQQPAYQLTPQPAATVAKAAPAPMVNPEQQMAQRQQLAALLQQLNAPLVQRQA